MNQLDEVRNMVATMLRSPADQVVPATSLASLDNSLGGARLKLGLKRLGLSLPGTSTPATFGELEAALFGKAPEKRSPMPDSGGSNSMMGVRPALRGAQVGIDIQDIRSLPTANDFWEHEFYVGLFGKSEIAYAVVTPEPRKHLAGFWCAKEALRKCDPSFMGVDFQATVVEHDQDGRPHLQWLTPSGTVRLPHALSLSHTEEMATAVVFAVATSHEVTPPSEVPQGPPAPKAESPIVHEPSHRSWIAMGSIALLVVGAVIGMLILHFWRS